MDFSMKKTLKCARDVRVLYLESLVQVSDEEALVKLLFESLLDRQTEHLWR